MNWKSLTPLLTIFPDSSMVVLQRWFERLWYNDEPKRLPVYLLLPFSLLYQKLVETRRRKFLSSSKPNLDSGCPVIVVGNISVGGTGKTPLVIWLAQQLQAHGYKPGVISRGYGGKATSFPQLVVPGSNPFAVGDEPAMIAQRLDNIPVVIDPDRARGCRYLNHELGCNIVVSDDGLQHYKLKRDIEIAVIDGKRGLGNGKCLPAGPLREPAARLDSVDFLIINTTNSKISTDNLDIPGLSSDFISKAISVNFQPGKLVSLQSSNKGQEVLNDGFNDLKQPVHALAGIGNPERFFDTLHDMGIRFQTHPFPDHFQYRPVDLEFSDNNDIVMTEKDAIKCQLFASTLETRCFFLPINAEMGKDLWSMIESKLNRDTG